MEGRCRVEKTQESPLVVHAIISPIRSDRIFPKRSPFLINGRSLVETDFNNLCDDDGRPRSFTLSVFFP